MWPGQFDTLVEGLSRLERRDLHSACGWGAFAVCTWREDQGPLHQPPQPTSSVRGCKWPDKHVTDRSHFLPDHLLNFRASIMFVLSFCEYFDNPIMLSRMKPPIPVFVYTLARQVFGRRYLHKYLD
jgi:hypothetical protein